MKFFMYLSIILAMIFLMITFVIPREFEVITFALFGLWSYIGVTIGIELEKQNK